MLNGFSIPVNPAESFEPDEKFFLEMCGKDRIFCGLVRARASNTGFNCYHFRIDEVVHEGGFWKEIASVKNMLCSFIHTLIRQLREKDAIHHRIQ